MSSRTSRSESWKERGRGSGRLRGGDMEGALGEEVATSMEGALGEEVATSMEGAAAMAATETRTPRTTVDRETDSTTPDTRAGGRKAAAADMTAGATLTEVGKTVHGIFHIVYLSFFKFHFPYETANSKKKVNCNSSVP